MIRSRVLWVVVAVLSAGSLSFGDFKYSETSKITGGALQGMTKFVGVFSKQARQATQPTESTTYVKGNRLRSDHSDGRVEIIDLDGRRVIFIDTQKKTYSITTFDQMKQALERARERAKAASAGKGQEPQAQQANLKVTPKADITPTGKTATILNLPAHEVKMRLDMQMESTDPKAEGKSATMWVTSDSWVTPQIPGYDEVMQFRQKMAKEIDWMPSTLLGGNAQTSQAMENLRKNSAALKGLPLLQYVSMGMEASGNQEAAGSQTQSEQPAPPSDVSNPEGAIVKGLGGMFGGFGHKKKKKEESAAGEQASAEPAAPPSSPGSLMDVTVQVTSYSSDPLDSSLFEAPAGYTELPSNFEPELSGTH